MPNLKMPYVNYIHLAGNLTKDAETASLKEKFKTTFRMAVSKKYTLANGQPREEVSYITVEMFSAPKFVVELKKGDPVYIVGEWKQDRWKNKDGESVVRDYCLVHYNHGGRVHILTYPDKHEAETGPVLGQEPDDPEETPF